MQQARTNQMGFYLRRELRRLTTNGESRFAWVGIREPSEDKNVSLEEADGD